jgi:hypothetical protein
MNDYPPPKQPLTSGNQTGKAMSTEFRELIPPSPEIKQFAETYRVLTRRDDCGELIVPGRMGHVYEHGPGRFGVYVECATKRAWSSAKRTLTAAGFTVRQNGDTEDTALFDPASGQQARLALATAKVRKRPVTTPAQRQAIADRLQINATPTIKGVLVSAKTRKSRAG